MPEWKRSVQRREFLKWCATAGAGALLNTCGQRLPKTPAALPPTGQPQPPTENTQPNGIAESQAPTTSPAAGQPYLAVARGESPEAITRAAVAALGGMERFVQPGAQVVIKPNICTDYYSYEYAATTNPTVVAALVSLALAAGAKRVRVMDLPFGGSAESAYVRSGIADAVQAAGGEMALMNPNKYVQTAIPNGRDLKEWPIYNDILEADVLINVPIAKHHGNAGLTLGCKNLMGTVLNRGQFHRNLHQRIADLNTRVRPTLTVIDAVRILMNNGPTGGNLNDVQLTNTVIASPDIISADAYAATLFGRRGEDVDYIRFGAEMGLGVIDLNSIKIEEFSA